MPQKALFQHISRPKSHKEVFKWLIFQSDYNASFSNVNVCGKVKVIDTTTTITITKAKGFVTFEISEYSIKKPYISYKI